MVRILAAFTLVAASASGLLAEVALANPGFPARERLTYIEKGGSAGATVVQDLAVLQDGGRQVVEIRSSSSSADSFWRLDGRTMLAFYSDVTERGTQAEVRRTSEWRSLSVQPRGDELLLTDLGSMAISLRGYPWNRSEPAKLVFAGQGAGMGGFTLELRCTGRETVRVPAGTRECYKLNLSLPGLFGGFMPKTNFWYDVKPPHALVRFEGSRSGSGGQAVVLELVAEDNGR